MPLKLERDLERQADKKGLTGDRKNAYVYGTMRNTGWKPSREQGSAQRKAFSRIQRR